MFAISDIYQKENVNIFKVFIDENEKELNF